MYFQGKNLPKPALLKRPIQELGIGTFRNIATVHQTSSLYEALSIFVERRVSALPVVDGQSMLFKANILHLLDIISSLDCISIQLLVFTGKVVALYSRFDVIVSTAEKI